MTNEHRRLNMLQSGSKRGKNMVNSKNILIIGDMPGYGKIGMAAVLPILSNMGHSVYNLPTALVSNNFDYGTFALMDTTQYIG